MKKTFQGDGLSFYNIQGWEISTNFQILPLKNLKIPSNLNFKNPGIIV